MPRESMAQPPAGLRAATPACSSGSSARLSFPETGQDRGSAKEFARTMPGRPHPICQAQVRSKSVVKINAPALIEGRERIARGSVHNVTDPEFPSHRIG